MLNTISGWVSQWGDGNWDNGEIQRFLHSCPPGHESPDFAEDIMVSQETVFVENVHRGPKNTGVSHLLLTLQRFWRKQLHSFGREREW